jgi:hypothetical protein
MADEKINFRVDAELKKAFDFVCRRNDTTSSQVLRGFMREQIRDYYRKYQQASFIPDDVRKTMKEQ